MEQKKWYLTFILLISIAVISSCIKEEVYYPTVKNLDQFIVNNYQQCKNGDQWFFLKNSRDLNAPSAIVCMSNDKMYLIDGRARNINQPFRKHIVKGNASIISTGLENDTLNFYYIDSTNYHDSVPIRKIKTEHLFTFSNYDPYSGQDMFYTHVNNRFYIAWWNGTSFSIESTGVKDNAIAVYISRDPDIGIWAKNSGTTFFHIIDGGVKNYVFTAYGKVTDASLGKDGNIYALGDMNVMVLKKGEQPKFVEKIYDNFYGHLLRATKQKVQKEKRKKSLIIL